MPTPEHRGATNAAGAFVAWAGVVLACVVLFAVVLATSSAHATTLGLHLVSVHSRPGYCDANPGLYLRTDSGWVVGAYRNSRCEASVYAAYALEHRFTPQWSAALALGAVSGYGPHLKPLAVPSLAVDLDDHNAIRLHIAPKVRPMRATFMHLSYERKF